MPRRGFYLGLALVAGSTLMLEIMLTRLFSVIIWYHMSLVAVSMAMFGMTLGALIVHWRPASFTPEKAADVCARHAQWFGLSVVVTLLVCLNTPFRVDTTGLSLNGTFLIFYWNAVAALPFVFSGVCVTVALTRFPAHVGKLYATDLAGASLACVVVVWLLNRVDALSAIMLVGALSLVASVAFGGKHRRVPRIALAVGITTLALFNASSHAIRVQYSAERYVGDEALRYDVWNSFSYIRVTPPKEGRFWHGGGDNYGKAPVPPNPGSFLYLTMDTRASTPITRFDGNWDDVAWLSWDATNFAHALRDDGPVLVIGVGGGRDVVSALVPKRGQRQVVGVEINPTTLSVLTEREREFSGNLPGIPSVRLYNDEARSWVARSTEKFQVITIPLVDTSAASAAGAFALTENSLYTLEAFELFYDHLTDDGVLSISRWWNAGAIGETHRMTAMAATALREKGVTDPRKNIVVARGTGLTNMLLSKRALTAEDEARLEAACTKYGFEPILLPSRGEKNVVASVEDAAWAKRSELSYVDVSPATDDRPFFFHSYRMTNLFHPANVGVAAFDRDAMVILLALTMLVSLLAVGVIAVPFRIEQKRSGMTLRREHASAMGFFAAIGLGFMLFESAQLQRLSIFLGYPIYALTVVLFGLLLSSSAGAFVAGRLFDRHGPRAVRMAALGLLVTIAVIGFATMPVVRAFSAATTPVRIVAAAALVAPAGFCMGMLFPMGLRIVERIEGVSLPWCWAINGMASTCAAVYGITLSISYGFTTTYWIGGVCYLIAGVLGASLARHATPTTTVSEPTATFAE